MKLYYCEATAVDHDLNGHVIANSKEEAEKKFAQNLDNEDIWYAGTIYVEELTEIGEYEVIIRKKC